MISIIYILWQKHIGMHSLSNGRDWDWLECCYKLHRWHINYNLWQILNFMFAECHKHWIVIRNLTVQLYPLHWSINYGLLLPSYYVHVMSAKTWNNPQIFKLFLDARVAFFLVHFKDTCGPSNSWISHS